MISIEAVFWLGLVLFTVVGFVRMWPRELGATIAILAGLLILLRFGEAIIRYLNHFASEILARDPLFPSEPSAARLAFYSVSFILVAFLGYQGDTLALDRQVDGVLHMALGGLVGLLNGYLVAGTLWWFLAWQGYPLPGEIFTSQLSDTALRLTRFLPPSVLPEPYILIALLGLILLRIVR